MCRYNCENGVTLLPWQVRCLHHIIDLHGSGFKYAFVEVTGSFNIQMFKKSVPLLLPHGLPIFNMILDVLRRYIKVPLGVYYSRTA